MPFMRGPAASAARHSAFPPQATAIAPERSGGVGITLRKSARVCIRSFSAVSSSIAPSRRYVSIKRTVPSGSGMRRSSLPARKKFSSRLPPPRSNTTRGANKPRKDRRTELDTSRASSSPEITSNSIPDLRRMRSIRLCRLRASRAALVATARYTPT